MGTDQDANRDAGGRDDGGLPLWDWRVGAVGPAGRAGAGQRENVLSRLLRFRRARAVGRCLAQAVSAAVSIWSR